MFMYCRNVNNNQDGEGARLGGTGLYKQYLHNLDSLRSGYLIKPEQNGWLGGSGREEGGICEYGGRREGGGILIMIGIGRG